MTTKKEKIPRWYQKGIVQAALVTTLLGGTFSITHKIIGHYLEPKPKSVTTNQTQPVKPSKIQKTAPSKKIYKSEPKQKPVNKKTVSKKQSIPPSASQTIEMISPPAANSPITFEEFIQTYFLKKPEITMLHRHRIVEELTGKRVTWEGRIDSMTHRFNEDFVFVSLYHDKQGRNRCILYQFSKKDERQLVNLYKDQKIRFSGVFEGVEDPNKTWGGFPAAYLKDCKIIEVIEDGKRKYSRKK